LVINLKPTDQSGEAEGSPLEEEIKSPEDLLGKTIYFYVEVIEALELPEDLCWDPFVRYGFYLEHKEEVPAVKGISRNPKFKYSKLMQIEVTKDILSYLENDSMSFSVYAYPTTGKPKFRDAEQLKKKKA